MVKRADTRNTRTSGMNTWRAGCGESRTSGSEGGPGRIERTRPISALKSSIAAPEQIAAVISWLLSAEAENVNGAVVAADGGWAAG
jgi:NAD(P)-dependent dehydrogenase (short-subunit alcohol dehydrogenase family)